MMAGMLVIYQGRAHHVLEVNGPRRGSHVPERWRSGDIIRLAPVGTDRHADAPSVWLDNPMAEEIPLLPACRSCQVSAGRPCDPACLHGPWVRAHYQQEEPC
jgi:hypothetical protein